MSDQFTSPARPRSWRRLVAGGALVLAMGAGFAGGRATLRATPSVAPASSSAAVEVRTDSTALPSYSAIVDRVAPAVATVRVERPASAVFADVPDMFRPFFGPSARQRGPQPRESGLGSGVIIREDGYILTNHHVIDGADRIRVDLADGRTLDATLVGSDPPSDLAVLRVSARGLPTVAFGDSDQVRVGDVVLAFGNPMGVGQTVTMGIVSAKGRATGVGDGNYEDFLQTDAPINRGNSGGALVDTGGRLVGINAQILSPSGGNIGLGFAIPAGMAHAVVDQLIDGGVVHRGRLGVTAQTISADLAAGLGLTGTHGALVSDVEAGSPAASAGIKTGDVIQTLDGRPIADANVLRNVVAASRPGTDVTIGLWREGRQQTVTARLMERTNAVAGGRDRREGGDLPAENGLGMSVQPLTPDLAEQASVPPSTRGIIVMDVASGSVAAQAGVQPGDVITRANGHDVSTVAALKDAIGASQDRPTVLLVMREGATFFIALPARS